MIKVESVYPPNHQSYYQRKQFSQQKNKYKSFQEILEKELNKKTKEPKQD